MTKPLAWIKEQEPSKQPLLRAARSLVRRHAPHATEHVYVGWNALGYKAPGLFCVIYPYGTGVKIAFERGRDLMDPHALLQQTGKRMKFVFIERTSDLSDAVGAFVAQAAALAADD